MGRHIVKIISLHSIGTLFIICDNAFNKILLNEVYAQNVFFINSFLAVYLLINNVIAFSI